MRVVQVVPSIADEASGPTYSVTQLSAVLAQHGLDVQLHALAPADSKHKSYQVRQYPRWGLLPRLGISPGMRVGLKRTAQECDVLHNHSLWMMPNMYAAWAARGTSCRLVVSPRGTLSRWALNYSRYRKAVVWWLGQRRAVCDADCLHATAASELREIRACGLKNPVAVIPNGIHIPVQQHDKSCGPRRLLFLGRIHAVKGVDVLLQAWRQVQESFPDWMLSIAGPGDRDYIQRVRRMADALKLDRASFLGPVFGQRKWESYQRADLFVLPTRSENFGVAVAESLACGTPAIATKGSPWEGLISNQCGWWIDHGPEPLAACLREAMLLPQEDLQSMGANGRRWMQSDFSWETVGQQMRATYDWLLGGGAPPSWVDAA